MKLDNLHHVHKSSIETTGLAVQEAIARRVSCRAYQPKPVPETQVMQILEAARLAPSACNQQPWRSPRADLRGRP